MPLRSYLKHLGVIIFYGVFCRRLGSLSARQGVILTYHRILPPKMVTACVESGMYVTPSTLKVQICFLKKYFNIVSMNQAEVLLKEVSKVSQVDAKPYCVISFDDGWRDFYTYAWPVLRDEGVPAIVFLPTGLIGTNKLFWTDRLSFILKENGLQALCSALDDIEDGKTVAVARAVSFQQQLAGAIELLKQYSYQHIEEILNECEEKVGSPQETNNRTFMDWGEVRELFASNLISFGSHAENHAILTTLSHDEVQRELQASKEKLIDEKVVSARIPFCYPNGNYNKNLSKLVEEAGYSSAVSCDPGWNDPDADMFNLKRISLHQDISSTSSLLAYRLTQYC